VVTVAEDTLPKLKIQFPDTANHPGLSYFRSSQKAAKSAWSLEKNRWLPDLNLEYFRGSNNAPNAREYNGFQIGVAIPLFFQAQKNRVRMSKLQLKATNENYIDYQKHLESRFQQLQSDLKKYSEAVNNYETRGESLAKELVKSGLKLYQSGAIGFPEYVMAIESAGHLMINYLESLHLYNQTVLDLNYLNY
jgi:cobalt-zinc-cadmium resistance protein CzcA